MDPPPDVPSSPAATADQIRNAIRQQVMGQTKDTFAHESVHASVPGHNHDLHISDLLDHYGYKANGNKYVFHKDQESVITVNSKGAWVHKHHGVHHSGHGHKSLASHLDHMHK